MKSSIPVFIIDTCIGGLSVVKSLHDSGYAGDAVFTADYAVNPLGVKNETEIADVVRRWLGMAEQHSDTAVIACNTLSVHYHALFGSEKRPTGLRQIVSMVDCFATMVKSETARLAGKKILVIGTAFTASRPVYADILRDALPDIQVDTVAATELERRIARFGPPNSSGRTVYDRDLRSAIENTDIAILACTCFPLISAELESLFPDVLFLDPGAYCENLLPNCAPQQVRKLQIKVTGDVVAPTRVIEFAKSYLGNTCVAS